jgi:hypothetical protein
MTQPIPLAAPDRYSFLATADLPALLTTAEAQMQTRFWEF